MGEGGSRPLSTLGLRYLSPTWMYWGAFSLKYALLKSASIAAPGGSGHFSSIANRFPGTVSSKGRAGSTKSASWAPGYSSLSFASHDCASATCGISLLTYNVAVGVVARIASLGLL